MCPLNSVAVRGRLPLTPGLKELLNCRDAADSCFKCLEWMEQQNQGFSSGHILQENSEICHEKGVLRPAVYGAQCVGSELMPQHLFADVPGEGSTIAGMYSLS